MKSGTKEDDGRVRRSFRDGLRALRDGVVSRPAGAFFLAAIVAKHAWVVAQIRPDTWTSHLPLALAAMGAALAISSFAFTLSGRAQLLALLGLDLVLTAILFGDLIHFRAFGALSSASSLRFAWQLGGVRASVSSLARPTDAWLFADLALFAGWLALPVAARFPRIRVGRAAALTAAGAVVCASVALASPRAQQYRYVGNAYVAGHLGLFAYHAWDIASALERLGTRAMGDPEAVEEAADRLGPKWSGRPAADPSLARAAEGLDVIVLQLESFQGYVEGLQIGGQAITPHLDDLAKESLRFPHFFHQAGRGNTSDAQFLALCSLHAQVDRAVAFDYVGNDFRCLPEVLADAGYETLFLHPYQSDYWNRAAFNPKQGFAQSLFERDFRQDETIGMGLSDSSFLQQAAERLERERRPFFAFLMTLSSHHPFDFPDMPKTLSLGALEGTPVGAYLHAVHYTDGAVGDFVERLRRSGVLDHALLVVYGDHQGTTRRSSNVADVLPLAADDAFAWFLEEKRVPLLVRLPHGAHAGEVEAVGGQIDLAPTMRRLLGAPGGGLVYLGHDLLAPERPQRVIFPDGSAFDGERLHLASEPDACRGPHGRLPVAACDALAREAAEELDLSETILEKNLVPAIRSEWSERRVGAR